MEKLIEMLDYYVNACDRSHTTEVRKAFYDQATGATQMFCFMNIELEPQVLRLWDNVYRPKFEELVYKFKPAGDL